MQTQLPSILIVDGNRDFCEALFDCFDDCGYDVNATQDAMTALHLAQTNRYDVAVLDLDLPGMNGISLFEEMRRLDERLQGILMTTFPEDVAHVTARGIGIREIVCKPVSFPNLVQTVHAAIAGA